MHITNGYLKVTGDNGYILVAPDDLGMISFNYINCDNAVELTLKAYDYDDVLQSDDVNLILPTSGSISFGLISTCDQVDEYFNFTIEQETYSIIDLNASQDGGPIISGFGIDSSGVEMYLLESIINTPQNPIYMQLNGMTNNGNFFNYACQQCQELEATLTQTAANVGDYFIGTFEGTINGNAAGVAVDVTGNFKVQRDN